MSRKNHVGDRHDNWKGVLKLKYLLKKYKY